MGNLGLIIMHEHGDGKEVAYPVDNIDWIKREGNLTHVHIRYNNGVSGSQKEFTVWVKETPSELVSSIGIKCSVILPKDCVVTDAYEIPNKG